MRRGERAASDIPLENKQNKSQLLRTGTLSRFIKLAGFSFFFFFSTPLSKKYGTLQPFFFFAQTQNKLCSLQLPLRNELTHTGFILTFQRLMVWEWSFMQLAGYLCSSALFLSPSALTGGRDDHNTDRCPVNTNTRGFLLPNSVRGFIAALFRKHQRPSATTHFFLPLTKKIQKT